jgi:hypothetical protein
VAAVATATAAWQHGSYNNSRGGSGPFTPLPIFGILFCVSLSKYERQQPSCGIPPLLFFFEEYYIIIVTTIVSNKY